MADVPFSHSVVLPEIPVERRRTPVAGPRWARELNLSPAMADGLIVLGGAVLFAVAGALLGGYLMLPFDVG